MRQSLKKILPKPVKKAFQRPYVYTQRLGRWIPVLVQVKGIDAQNEAKIIGSALGAVGFSLRDISRWQDPTLFWDAIVNVSSIGTFRLRRRTDDLWHVLPWREEAIITVLRECLRPGDCFVDAGANIGIYTIFASRLVGADGKVIAIEMIPDTAKRLRHHIEINARKNVVVVEKALSSHAGQQVLARVPVGKCGQASIADHIGTDGSEVSVDTTTLDDELDSIDEIALMKMDLEGAEQMALAGGSNVLHRIRNVVFEDWGDAALSDFFQNNGFIVLRLDGSNCLAKNLVYH